jgi:hypothetical protein
MMTDFEQNAGMLIMFFSLGVLPLLLILSVVSIGSYGAYRIVLITKRFLKKIKAVDRGR